MTVSSDTLVAIGSLIGGLIGAISWLFRIMIRTKDQQIKQLEDELRDARSERDLFRSLALARRED